MKTYSFIYRWKNEYGTMTELELHDKTEREADIIASSFGWTKPRWWQFWRLDDYVLKTSTTGEEHE